MVLLECAKANQIGALLTAAKAEVDLRSCRIKLLLSNSPTSNWGDRRRKAAGAITVYHKDRSCSTAYNSYAEDSL
jgi:hypothetical protein